MDRSPGVFSRRSCSGGVGFNRPCLRAATISLCLAAAAGCSESTGVDDDDDPVGITVTVTPSAPSVRVGLSVEVTAVVTGTPDPDVFWTDSCGRFDEDVGAVVTFTAPWTPGECEVRATSFADTSKWHSVVITVTPVPAAQNLLPNGTFASDLAGWFVHTAINGFPYAQWNAEDAAGSSGSGSVEVSHPDLGNGGMRLGLSVCLPSSPGRRYGLLATAKLAQPVASAFPEVVILSFGHPQCGGEWLPDDGEAGRLVFNASPNSWSTLGSHYTTPPGTTHVSVWVGVWKGIGNAAPAAARFDNLFLVEDD